ncbi:hypothetical protein YC2023_059885 [Brassica napus]
METVQKCKRSRLRCSVIAVSAEMFISKKPVDYFIVFSLFVDSLVSLPFTHPDQIEILLAFRNEFPILKRDFSVGAGFHLVHELKLIDCIKS